MEQRNMFDDFLIRRIEEQLVEHIQHALSTRGLVTFHSLVSPEEFLLLCKRLGTIVGHRDTDEKGITRIIQRNESEPEGFKAFSSSQLTLHTDGCSVNEPAHLAALWCRHPAEEGGLSLLADGKQFFRLLADHSPHTLDILSTPESALFTGERSILKSSILCMHPCGNVAIRFRNDSLGYYSAPVASVLPAFLDVLHSCQISFRLEQHQGYIISNGRWLHGRTSFKGDRELYRILIHVDAQMTGRLYYFNPTD